MRTLLQEIDETARKYHETKEQYYKNLWYKKIKEWSNGPHNTERWNVSVSSVNKTNDGTYVISGKRIRSI
tara:strand:+ start:35 stop:244 length:210 start_codon:yes stop_codon:yes gene_type:complete